MMESFDLDAAQLAGFSKWDSSTLEVTTEFPDKDSFLKEVEKEYGLDEDDSVDGKMKMEIDLGDTESHLKTLQSTLRNKDDVSMAERTGASRTEGFTGSVGKDSLRSNDTQ